MPWRCTAREHLDDDHATAAAWTSRLAVIGGGTGELAFRFCNGEQLTRAGDVVGAGKRSKVRPRGDTPVR
jgi:hypothetical protein